MCRMCPNYTIFVEGGGTIQGDVLIKKSALSEGVWYLLIQCFTLSGTNASRIVLNDINSKYPNRWLENFQFSVKSDIFKSAVWVLWVDINEIFYII